MSDDRILNEIDFFQTDSVLMSKALEECAADIIGSINDFTNILSPVISQNFGEMLTPTIFRKPAIFHTPTRLVKSQRCTQQKLTYPSFNQPSTPKTPAFASSLGTPLMSAFEVAMLTTPMLIKTLDNIQEEAGNKNRLSPYPDILQLIDDDSKCTGARLDHHLKQCSDSNVMDSNLADYSADLSNEASHHNSSDTRTMTEKKLSMDEIYKSPPRVFNRARRRTKLMTEDERISIQRQQREKQKQRRKNKFTNKPRAGTRKSRRVRKQVVRYS